jgi:hypothetical protein
MALYHSMPQSYRLPGTLARIRTWAGETSATAPSSASPWVQQVQYGRGFPLAGEAGEAIQDYASVYQALAEQELAEVLCDALAARRSRMDSTVIRVPAMVGLPIMTWGFEPIDMAVYLRQERRRPTPDA